jgi:hypothetical protein
MNEDVYRKVFENIKATGRYPAGIVRPKKGTDRFEILDGWHRKQIVTELGHDVFKCEIWDVDDKQAKLLLATLNRLKGTDDTKKRAKLLTDLYDEFNQDKTILNFIPESERSLDSMLDSIKTDLGTFDEEMERGMVEQKLMQAGVDTELAQQIADGYKPPSGSNVWVLKFVFKDVFQYNKAVDYFGKKGNPEDLLTIIEQYGEQNLKTKKDTEV